MRGVLVLIVTYLVIFWVDPATTEVAESPSITSTGVGQVSTEHYFDFGLISIPETKIGGICLFFAVCLTLIRKNLSEKFHSELGGAKRLYALSLTTSACMMFPFALFQYANVREFQVIITHFN
jgi:hypothetical protein